MRALVVSALCTVALTVPAGAHAAFPGANGAVAFMHGVDGVFEVAVLASDGGAPRALIPSAEAPAFSPDGRWIAYAVPPARNRREGLRLARADGTHRRVLTRNTVGSDTAPAWSSDGRQIVFHRYVAGEGSFGAVVYTIRRDGSQRRRLARGLFPAWSSRGRIAFVHQISATAPFTDGIHTVRPDGSGLRRLTRDARDSAPNSVTARHEPHLHARRRARPHARRRLRRPTALAPRDGTCLVAGRPPHRLLPWRRALDDAHRRLRLAPAHGAGHQRGVRRPDWQPV